MDRPFLIEIRLMGEPKHIARQLIYDIYHKFRIMGAVKQRPVPHVTLFGPFGCKSVNNIINAIGEVGSQYSELTYQIDGFDYFELKKKFLFITTSVKKNVIFLKIVPSENLKEFRYNLAKKLLKIADSINIDNDSKEKFQFHATLAMKDIDKKFDVIWEYLKNYEIKSSGICYRITLLREGKIMYEYDFKSQQLLNRRQVIGNITSRQYRYRQEHRKPERRNYSR